MTVGSKQFGVLKSNSANNPNLEVNIRSQPSTSASRVASRNPGYRVEVLGSRAVSGFTWYEVRGVSETNIRGWVRQDVIQLEKPQPDPSPGPGTLWKLTVAVNTIFKQRPIDSSQLVDEDKQSVSAGSTYNIKAYTDEGSHLRVTLANNLIKNKNTWYVFQDHVRITKIS